MNIISLNIENSKFKLPEFFLKEIYNMKDVLIISSTLSKLNLQLIEDFCKKKSIAFNKYSFYDIDDNYNKEGVSIITGSLPPSNYPEESAASRLAIRLNADTLYYYSDRPPLYVIDRNIVTDSKVIDELTLSEAGSLAFYGSALVHPEIFYKAVRSGIKVYISSLISNESTLIKDNNNTVNKRRVKGFQIIEKVSILTLEGVSLQGRPHTASRMCSAVGEKGISILMLSQGASESSISIVVRSSDASLASSAIDEAFHNEIIEGSVESVDINSDNTIIAAVGDGVSTSTRVISSFFMSLSSLKINVKLTNASPRDKALSAVIATKDVKKALSALYAGFYLSRRTISTGIIGVGNIGKALIEQLASQSSELTSLGIDIKVRAITNSKKMLLSDTGINLSSWKDDFEKNSVPLDIDRMVDFLDSDKFPNTLIVDCTASDTLPEKYLSWLERNIHIVTPNKKAGVTPYEYYDSLLKACQKTGTLWLHEATVGAGLPVISTLNDLINTGDKVKSIQGIFSGSLGWLFSYYDGKTPFSSLVLKAMKEGYTEPDPREDLSGMDIARKTVILAREVGIQVNLSDIKVTSLVPENLKDVSKEEFISRISEMDDYMKKIYQEAEKENKVLRYVGGFDENKKCFVRLEKFDKSDPFANSLGTDNVISFVTERYFKQPLTIKGPGAGLEVTAGGVFADILRLCSYLGALLW